MLLDVREPPEVRQRKMLDSLLQIVQIIVAAMQELFLLGGLRRRVDFTRLGFRRELVLDLDFPIQPLDSPKPPHFDRPVSGIALLHIPEKPLKVGVIPHLRHVEHIHQPSHRQTNQRVVSVTPACHVGLERAAKGNKVHCLRVAPPVENASPTRFTVGFCVQNSVSCSG